VGDSKDVFTVGLLYPQQGVAGLFGPSCRASAELAAALINARDGILGRELHLRSIDAATGPEHVVRSVRELVDDGAVDALVGWQTSDVRHALARELRGDVPYVYTALYEGGESADGVFLTGETPERQVGPAMSWLREAVGVTSWFVVGSDYRWPQATAVACRRFAAALGTPIRGESFTTLGTDDFGAVLRRIERSGVSGVLMLLLGQDAVAFNRAFAASGLDEQVVRFSPLMDENMLLAAGPESTQGVYAAAGYFESLPTRASMDFNGQYFDQFGPDACVPTAVGESCLEGLFLLEQLIGRSGSADVRAIQAAEGPIRYHGPRGEVTFSDHHVATAIHIAAADGCDFQVLDTLR